MGGPAAKNEGVGDGHGDTLGFGRAGSELLVGAELALRADVRSSQIVGPIDGDAVVLALDFGKERVDFLVAVAVEHPA